MAWHYNPHTQQWDRCRARGTGEEGSRMLRGCPYDEHSQQHRDIYPTASTLSEKPGRWQGEYATREEYLKARNAAKVARRRVRRAEAKRLLEKEKDNE